MLLLVGCEAVPGCCAVSSISSHAAMGLARTAAPTLPMAPTNTVMDWEGGLRFVWVGLAGAAGAIARYALGLNVDQSRFPWATLGINLTGAFVLGLFLTFALGRLPISVMTPIAVGLIGGFTTFSTFAWEGFTMGRGGRPAIALLYVCVSVLGGLTAAWSGYTIGQALR